METPLLKIDTIRRCLRRVRETASSDPALLDQNVQDVVVLNLQRACEQAIDLANWFCSYRNFDIPRTSQEVFTVIEREGILSAEGVFRCVKWSVFEILLFMNMRR